MRTLVKLCYEAVGLFVDDGTLAATVVLWIALCSVSAELVPFGAWQGPVLFVGLAVILVENASRGARSCCRASSK